MEKKEIEMLGKKEKLTGRQLQDFTKFIMLRFPNENDELYIREWGQRFREGVELWKADGKSKEVLMKVNGPYYRSLMKAEEAEIKRFEKAQGFRDISIGYTLKLPVYSKRRKV